MLIEYLGSWIVCYLGASFCIGKDETYRMIYEFDKESVSVLRGRLHEYEFMGTHHVDNNFVEIIYYVRSV